MCLHELCICNSAFPAYCCCQKLQSCCCKALLISHHSPTKPGSSDLSCHFLAPSLLSVPYPGSALWPSRILSLAYCSYFILYLFHGFISFFPALSLVFLSLMHFLCHSVLQASHVKSPAFPQIPSSFLVSSSTVSFSCCPRNCIFPK